MVNRGLSAQEIHALSLVVASKATTSDDLEKIATDVFEIYEKTKKIYERLSLNSFKQFQE